jgi:hypothetical protein
MHVSEAIARLDRDLRGHFGARLQSVVAYGLGGRGAHETTLHATDAHDDDALLHTLAIVDAVSADDLRALARRVESWHEQGLATPLLLAAREFERSLDAFPFELGAIVADHVVVSGADPFDGVTVEGADLRRACEVQARGHLLHLREACLEARGRDDALSDVIVRSAPAFAALVTTVARLDKDTPGADPVAAARALERRLGLPHAGVSAIVALAGVREIPSGDAEALFGPYLAAVERLVGYVDGWRHA